MVSRQAVPVGPHPSPTECCPYPEMVESLAIEFDKRFPTTVIEELVANAARRFDDAPVRTFLEILTYRAARDDLATRARASEPERGPSQR